MTQSIKGKNSAMLCLAKTVSGKQMLCRGMGEKNFSEQTGWGSKM